MPDLEPRTRTGSTTDTVSARIHDPLWLLTRQWQFGEFRAGNGGAPVRTEITPEPFPLSRMCAGAPSVAGAVAYDPAKLPLETAVEREALPARSVRDPGMAVEAGLHFLRLLEAAGAGSHAPAYRTTYALSRAAPDGLRRVDPGGAAVLEPMAGRVPDAKALYADLSAAFGPDGDKAGAALPAAPAIPAADAATVTSVVRAWLRWYRGQGASVPDEGAVSPWIADRMEYRFAVAGSGSSTGEVVLSAPEYAGGRLDWTSFVVSPGASLGVPRPAARPKDTRTVIPMPVSFRGMPAPRFWAFEDAGVNLGAMDPGGTAHQLLLEFALVYGDDWFVVPLEFDVGSLCRIAELRVVDSFGEPTVIRHASAVDGPSSGWRMFTVSRDPLASTAGAAPGADLLFLAPALGPMLGGAPVEDVLLVRDEMANLAWAIERTVTGAAGTLIDRLEAWRAGVADAAPEPAVGGAARYRLGTSVPDHWFPLTLDDAGVYLKRGTLPNGGMAAAEPRGRLLPGTVRLFEEEVPREGAHVTRAFQHTRWTNGSSHLWLGRRKSPGRGEGSSGLRFDHLEWAE